MSQAETIRRQYIVVNPKNPKILLFSDLHAHEYKPFAQPTAQGVNSRLMWILKTLEAIFNYATTNEITQIFFLGDLFHTRPIIYSIVFTEISKLLYQNHVTVCRMYTSCRCLFHGDIIHSFGHSCCLKYKRMFACCLA